MHRHKNMRFPGIVKAIVKFGDAARTNQCQKFFVSTGLFRQGDRQHGFRCTDFKRARQQSVAGRNSYWRPGYRHQRFVFQFVFCAA